MITYFKIIILITSLLASTANAWTINQSFDSQSNGEKCAGWSSTRSVVSSAAAASQSKSCKLRIAKGSRGFGEWGGIIKFPSTLKNGDEIWVRMRNYFPIGFDYNASTRLKFLRIKTFRQDGSNGGYDDWYINRKGSVPPFQFIYEGSSRADLGWTKFGTSSDVIKLGVWETYEMYIKFGTKSVDNGGTGRVRVWKNGKLMKDITNRVTFRAATDYANSLYIYTYWNDTPDTPRGSPQTQNSYVDDVIVTSTRPTNKDSHGNNYVGVGSYVPTAIISAPLPPKINP